MVERRFKKNNLELKLISVTRIDILVRNNQSSKIEKIKVGERDTYEFDRDKIEGNVFYKEVYDNEGNLKSTYFDHFFSTEEEILKIAENLGISIRYMEFENPRKLL